jgi:hypothetical protein
VKKGKLPEEWPEQSLEMPRDPRADDPEPDLEFRCYPLRGDSLAYSARRAGPRLFAIVIGTVAAFCAAAYIYFRGVPIGANARLGALALYGAPVAIATGLLGFYAVVALIRRPGEWRRGRRVQAGEAEAEKVPEKAPAAAVLDPLARALEPAEGSTSKARDASSRRGSAKAAVQGLVAMVLLGGTAAIVALIADRGLLTDTAFWVAWGLSVAAPLLLIGAVLAAHEFRGSVPSALTDVRPGAAVIATVWVAAGEIPANDMFPEWFVLVFGSVAALALGTFGVRKLRKKAALHENEARDEAAKAAIIEAERTGREPTQRVAPPPFCTDVYHFMTQLLLLVPPVALLVALAIQLDADWVPEFALAVMFVFVSVVLVARNDSKPETEVHRERLWRFGTRVRFMALFAWVTIVLVLLREVGDGWITNGLLAGVTFLVMALGTILLTGLAAFSPMIRAFVGMVLGAGFLGLFALGVDVGYIAAAAAGFVALATASNWNLRSGELNANMAEHYVARALNVLPGRTDQAPDGTSGWFRRNLASALYFPYGNPRTPGKRGPVFQTTGLRAGVLKGLAKALAEMGDADEPPFFKNLLRADVSGRGGNVNRVLTLRCFGITGYRTEEDDPPVEHEIEIPFRSQGNWESHFDATWG